MISCAFKIKLCSGGWCIFMEGRTLCQPGHFQISLRGLVNVTISAQIILVRKKKWDTFKCIEIFLINVTLYSATLWLPKQVCHCWTRRTVPYMYNLLFTIITHMIWNLIMYTKQSIKAQALILFLNFVVRFASFLP